MSVLARAARAAAPLLLLAAALVAPTGCRVDSVVGDETIYDCDGASPEADASCGEGWACYRTGAYGTTDVCTYARALGCPEGYVGSANGCLRACAFQDGDCPAGLECVRTSYVDDRGVCFPMRTCNTSADCTDPVRSYCLADGLAAAGYGRVGSNVCLQLGCAEKQEACLAGTTCLRAQVRSIRNSAEPGLAFARAAVEALGLNELNVPDYCVPNCGPGLRCPPGTFCLGDIFDNATLNVCLIGYLTAFCQDDIDCQAGTCRDAYALRDGSVIRICSIECESDADCANSEPFTSARCGETAFGTRICLGGGREGDPAAPKP